MDSEQGHVYEKLTINRSEDNESWNNRLWYDSKEGLHADIPFIKY